MPIVPAQEAKYRSKIRSRLTLDLFTRYGTFWTYVDALRDQWRVSPTIGVPPEPPCHAESVELLTRSQMPEQFHLPSFRVTYGPPADDDPYLAMLDARFNVYFFLKSLEHVWKSEVARPHERDGDWRHGANVSGWMSWAPFLSACVLYDPPHDTLLEFADHDDNNAAALQQRTFSQDGDAREEAGVHRAAFLSGDLTAVARYGEALRSSYYEANASIPRGKRGRPPDPLLDVQCAIWRVQDKLTTAEIGRRIGRKVRDNRDAYGPGHPSHRERSDAAEEAVNRGIELLTARNAWARITTE